MTPTPAVEDEQWIETTYDTTTLYSITVRIRLIDTLCQIEMHGEASIGELITDISQKANLTAPPDHYYLMFDAHELDINDTIRKSGLLNSIGTSVQSYPELRLKVVHQVKESIHLGTHVVLISPEKLVYQEILKIPASPTQKQIMPEILQPLAKQTFKHKSQSSMFLSNLISMPVFTKQVIDELPSIRITISLKQDKFNWNTFLKFLAIDLEIDRNDMFLMSAQEGSTKFEIKFKASISLCKKKMKKIAEKLCVIILPTSRCAQFIAEQKSLGDITEVSKIEAKLHNFFEGKNSIEAETSLTPDDIDAVLTLVQRPAIIDAPSWQYLTEKSREISSCILHAFQMSPIEYVIENLSLVHNEDLYKLYHDCYAHGEEKILFHGTQTSNFDGIFEKNFQNFVGSKRTDSGWYGRGIYFSTSPKYCASYAHSDVNSIVYLICSLVKLGKMYHVTDMSYMGKEMRVDSDSHYVKVTASGHPTNAEHSFFEEFVIKQSNQILPLYIIGLRPVHRFVLWRDPKISDDHNGPLFAQMKQGYNFNIYGSETSAEALAVLECKLNDPKMQCVVVTNGADKGEEFVRQCRNMRSSLPMIVYCSQVGYHKLWATKIGGHPEIQVTGSSNDVFNFINSTFPKTAI
ncbi:unnamed protein product [Didymodactylos carnosus]|uniref:Poly [ADP-ribose] polymerase n=1 Tax=Didymodactylos carnosus TaxID=1234261 RepID=A0A815RJC5_9BILA|nr:unnamed protein product [Didymodactylos carnosus]CAF4343555.1 unnamed protein product [Didymodactylos carnosus]